MTRLKVIGDQLDNPPSRFFCALADWMRAKAICCDNEANPDANEDQIAAGSDAVLAAEWKLLQTPAQTIQEIRERGQVVQKMIRNAETNGLPMDGRHHLMMGALLADLNRYRGKH
jgi:hypothetical protein